jgi:hypothetical protein
VAAPLTITVAGIAIALLCNTLSQFSLSTVFEKSGWAVLGSPGWRPSVFHADGRFPSPGVLG